jgi:hypothetical protein
MTKIISLINTNLFTFKSVAEHELLFNKPEIGLVNINLTYVAQQSVTKIKSLTILNLLTPKAGAEHELLFNQKSL